MLPDGPCKKGGSEYGCSWCMRCECCYFHNFPAKSKKETKTFPMQVIDGLHIEVNVTVNGFNITNRTLTVTTGLPVCPELVPDIIRGMLVKVTNSLEDADVVIRLEHKTKTKKVEL